MAPSYKRRCYDCLGDVDGDGRFDVVVASGEYIYALDSFGREI